MCEDDARGSLEELVGRELEGFGELDEDRRREIDTDVDDVADAACVLEELVTRGRIVDTELDCGTRGVEDGLGEALGAFEELVIRDTDECRNIDGSLGPLIARSDPLEEPVLETVEGSKLDEDLSRVEEL